MELSTSHLGPRRSKKEVGGEEGHLRWFVTGKQKLEPVKKIERVVPALLYPPSSFSIPCFPREVLRTCPLLSGRWPPQQPPQPQRHILNSSFFS